MEEAKKKIADIEKQKRVPNLKPEQIAAIDNQVKAAKGELANVAQGQFEQRAEQFGRRRTRRARPARECSTTPRGLNARADADPTSPVHETDYGISGPVAFRGSCGSNWRKF